MNPPKTTSRMGMDKNRRHGPSGPHADGQQAAGPAAEVPALTSSSFWPICMPSSMRRALWKRCARLADYNRDCFMALGLDPERTEFVYGTDYQLKPEYMLKILQIARNTTLNRAKRSMDEVSRSAENPMVSQNEPPAQCRQSTSPTCRSTWPWAA